MASDAWPNNFATIVSDTPAISISQAKVCLYLWAWAPWTGVRDQFVKILEVMPDIRKTGGGAVGRALRGEGGIHRATAILLRVLAAMVVRNRIRAR
jgi:hypothetical protein